MILKSLFNLTFPIALILGNEARGIAAKHLSHTLHQVHIPMQGYCILKCIGSSRHAPL
ncbi:hypothetical protein [Candidatus Cardinium hertigii]|uniref:hypothetical protein n=1 Tax=Candidatus Cardinium hertigii TaxID=247481 RepID=UPI001620CE43|nr:hypothetical protein [Candidatus Cardinium hertigii]